MFICGCWPVAVNGSHGQMIDRERAPNSGIRLFARRDRAGIWKIPAFDVDWIYPDVSAEDLTHGNADAEHPT
jgi:hypothetical protein